MSYLNRTMCDVLEEMRKCHETRNYAHLMGLVEEAQTFANRMEAALSNLKDADYAYRKKRKLEKEVSRLEKEIESLEDQKESVDATAD